MQYQHRWFWLSAVIIFLDQFSKIIAENLLTYGQAKPLMPFFNWLLVYNQGAAFSFLSQAGGWQRWFFVALSLGISILLIVWIAKLSKQEKWTSLALAFILGGAVGNLIDRVMYGYVVDFIDFYYPSSGDCLPLFGHYTAHTCHWPTFNIADSAICIGAAILLFLSFFGAKKADPPD